MHAAAGLFYGSISGNEWNTMTNFQPLSTRLTFTNTNPKTSDTGVPLGASLSNPYNAFVGGPPFPYTGAFATGGGLFAVSPDFNWPHSYQTNVGVDRQLGKTLSVGASYVGTFGRDLPFARDVNYPVVNSTATSAGANILARRPNPAVGAILLLDSDQTSSYNGLQVTVASRPGITSSSTASTRSARRSRARSCRTTPRRAWRRTTAIWPRKRGAPTPISATSST